MTADETALTCAQRQLWELDAGGAPPRALNLSYALAIDGPLDLAALSAAFGTLIQAHEPLRTTYSQHDGVVTAEIIDACSVPPAIAPLVRAADAKTVAAAAAADRARAFDLGQDLPLRAELFQLGPDRHVMVLTMHHIASDGWSIYLLRTQLSQYYAAYSAGHAVPAIPSARLRDIARAQREWLASPAAGEDARWWLDQLRGAVPRPAGLRPATAGRAVLLARAVSIPDELSRELRGLARQAGLSLYVVLLTAFAVLLERCLDCARPVIGTLVANRPTAASSQVMGAHYNTLLLDIDVDGDPSLAECLLRAADRVLAALDRQSLPLPALTARLEREFGWEAARTPSVMFIMDRYPMEGLDLAGCRTRGLYLDAGGELYEPVPAAVTADLVFFVREARDRLTLSMLWRAGAIPDTAADELAAAYLEILAAMAESPELALTDLCLWQAATTPIPAHHPTLPATADQTGPAPVLRAVADLAPVDALSPVAGPLPGSPVTVS